MFQNRKGKGYQKSSFESRCLEQSFSHKLQFKTVSGKFMVEYPLLLWGNGHKEEKKKKEKEKNYIIY